MAGGRPVERRSQVRQLVFSTDREHLRRRR